MLKYIWKSLKIDEIRSEIVRYGLQCSEKLEISKSDEKSRKIKVVPTGLPGVENVPTPRESILTLSRGAPDDPSQAVWGVMAPVSRSPGLHNTAPELGQMSGTCWATLWNVEDPPPVGHNGQGYTGSEISLNYDFRSKIEVSKHFPQILINYDRWLRPRATRSYSRDETDHGKGVLSPG